jgi:hypothetical protein
VSAARNLEQLFAAASTASASLMEGRDLARQHSVRAIREVERRLRSAIAGDTLRGMSNLFPVRGAIAQQAARVVGREGAHTDFFAQAMRKLDEPVPFGRSAMVLTKEGELMVFEVGERGEFSSRPAEDGELTAQDLDAVLHTVRAVLERHVQRAERTAANYARISGMAAQLGRLLGP